MSNESADAYRRLLDSLHAKGTSHRLTRHRAVFTSAEAAEVRGSSLRSGAKALILKGDDQFVMAVLPADMSLDSKRVRELLGWRTLRFATKDELLECTGLTPGSVPPFGSLFGLPTICDPRLAENDEINFNAASHEQSILMRYADYLSHESPRVASIARPPSSNS
jgi:Ala-tRNA(Pro) deacylase